MAIIKRRLWFRELAYNLSETGCPGNFGKRNHKYCFHHPPQVTPHRLTILTEVLPLEFVCLSKLLTLLIGFAIPVNIASKVREALISEGKVRRGYVETPMSDRKNWKRSLVT